jgi:AraC family transcriptional activator of pobA
MEKIESLDEFYKNQFDCLSSNIQKDCRHFNVFHLKSIGPEKANHIPFKRLDYYRVMLIIGSSKIHYTNKVVEIKKQALTFSSPHFPFKCENSEAIIGGFYCVFNERFFFDHENFNQYSIFKPNGEHFFELTDEQLLKVTNIYERMFEEINSGYLYKYEVLRNLVSELLHFALKIQPATKSLENQPTNALQRISKQFLELLERQFPIDEDYASLQLHNASDFANQLNVHVNYLNRALKETTQKTTTQIIAERFLQESKMLLKHSKWNVSEIAYTLGFSEVTHFNNFFKKHMQTNPSKFRNIGQQNNDR